MRAGGADNYVKGITFDFLSKRTGWEPTDLIEYLQNIAAKLGPEKVTFEKNQAFKVETEKWIQIYPPPEDSRLSLPPEPPGDPRLSLSSVPPGNPRLSLPPEPPGDPRLSLPEPPDFDASFDLMAEELFISPPGLRRSSSYVPPPPPGLQSSSNAPGAGGQRLSLPPRRSDNGETWSCVGVWSWQSQFTSGNTAGCHPRQNLKGEKGTA